jgi:glutamine amidotransferase
MCRFLAYSGKPVLMHDLLYSPKNSLINQSIRANEADEPLNGDGFGIGWYNHEIDKVPGLYTSIRPAWNDHNLKSLSKKIKANCLFAHVRAASTGEVSESNCHPFVYKNFIFMHNGSIHNFDTTKRMVRRKLNDQVYNWIRGQTDSEHLFALFIHNLTEKYQDQQNLAPEKLVEVMRETILEIEKIKKDLGLKSNNFINMCLSDGNSLIALRYVTEKSDKASTLYYSEGGGYECVDGHCHMVDHRGDQHRSVLIVSEKLTTIKKEWTEIKTNHFVIIDQNHLVKVVPF